jgi:hypothetical protein
VEVANERWVKDALIISIIVIPADAGIKENQSDGFRLSPE